MTADQQRAADRLRDLPGRPRVTHDVEGWPLIPGRYGRIEYDDPLTLAVFTDRPRLFAKILAVPGVRRHQTGDREARMLFPSTSYPAVAQLIGARRKRALSPEQARRLGAGTAYRPTNGPGKAPRPPVPVSAATSTPSPTKKSA
jgi:hypothetical protein